MIGTAQEKTSAWRGWRDGGPDGHPHFEFARQTVFVNHYYFYISDPGWGPAFVKTCAYAPFPVWVYLNGHEWAKRQAAKAGIAFEALDNGFRSDADALAAICDRLCARDVERFFSRWQRRRDLADPPGALRECLTQLGAEATYSAVAAAAPTGGRPPRPSARIWPGIGRGRPRADASKPPISWVHARCSCTFAMSGPRPLA